MGWVSLEWPYACDMSILELVQEAWSPIASYGSEDSLATGGAGSDDEAAAAHPGLVPGVR